MSVFAARITAFGAVPERCGGHADVWGAWVSAPPCVPVREHGVGGGVQMLG